MSLNSTQLRALVAAQDSLRAAMLATAPDDHALRDRIRDVGADVGVLIVAAVKDQAHAEAGCS